MAHIIDLKTYCDKRGNLTVIEKVLPFAIKRIFYIYGVDDSVRGGHRHRKTVQAQIDELVEMLGFIDYKIGLYEEEEAAHEREKHEVSLAG